MRAGRLSEPVAPVTFDGRPIEARRGETVAAALAANGVMALRTTRGGSARGLFCGMGVCQDCLVEIDGRPNQRACMTKIERPMAVRTQRFPPALAPDPGDGPCTVGQRAALTPDVLVIGGGAGGLTAAALAAEAGASVLLIDERPAPGGQYFKQPIDRVGPDCDDSQYSAGRRLIARVQAARVTVLRATVWAACVPLEITVHDDQGSRTIRPRQLVVATGAFERALPVPGWTLPGVLTTGAAQTLLRSYRVLAGRRIVVAGHGPLNLQVACELHRAGAQVLAVAELAARPGPHGLAALARMALSAPGLTAKGAGYLGELRRAGIRLHYRHVLHSIAARDGGLLVRLRHALGPDGPDYAADVVTMGYGFLPANEILRLLGCRHSHDPVHDQLVTVRDGACRTTVPNVLAVGDCCGLGGALAAAAEGVIAGLTAAEALDLRPPPAAQRERQRAVAALVRQRRFQSGLWQLFQAQAPGLELADADTIVCRCEEVTLGQIEAALAEGSSGMGSLKRRTRAGMGRCQGRYCGPLLAGLLQARTGQKLDELALFAPRPPLRPVPIEAIAGMPAPTGEERD